MAHEQNSPDCEAIAEQDAARSRRTRRRPPPEAEWEATDEELAERRKELAERQEEEAETERWLLERAERRVRAEKMLRSWAEAHAKRDEVIRTALAAGISAHRIQRITGVARTTIARIVTGL